MRCAPRGGAHAPSSCPTHPNRRGHAAQLLGHPVLCAYISEQDEVMLQYLLALHVSENEDVKSGYHIALEFAPNPFFHDARLTKEVEYQENGTARLHASEVCSSAPHARGFAPNPAHRPAACRSIGRRRARRWLRWTTTHRPSTATSVRTCRCRAPPRPISFAPFCGLTVTTRRGSGSQTR